MPEPNFLSPPVKKSSPQGPKLAPPGPWGAHLHPGVPKCRVIYIYITPKSPKIDFFGKMTKNIKKIAKMQKSRIFSLEPRSRELFAFQKPVVQKTVFV